MNFKLKKQIAIVACLYIGELAVGFIAWSSPVIPKLQDPKQTPLSYIITDSQTSWVGAASLPGTLLGSSISSWISNGFGRKPGLLFGGILLISCYIILATAQDIWMILIGRFLNGAGIGIVYVSNLTYITEIASTNIRGMLLTATGFFTSAGVLLVFAIGPYFSYAGIMYTGLTISLLFTVGTLFIPETPAFHVWKGKETEAERTLVSLGRLDDFEEVLSLKPPKVKSKIRGLRDVFFIPTNRKALFVSLVIYMCQGMSGFVTVLFYATSIFQSVNSSIDPGVATITVGVTQLLSSCVAPLFVEKKGRKKLLIVSTAGCSLSMALLGFYFVFHHAGDHTPSQFHWIPLFSVISFLISYQSGYYTIPGACSNEMFDSTARGPGFSIAFSAGTIFCFAVTATFGYISSTIGSHVIFLWFAFCSAVSCVFSSVFLIETKGKSLAEVQVLLRK